MTCVAYSNGLHITYGSNTYRRMVRYCPICSRRTRMVCQINTGWYSPIIQCCSCGDSWCEGELMERPFKRGWRKEAIASAQDTWRSALSARDAKKSDLEFQKQFFSDVKEES